MKLEIISPNGPFFAGDVVSVSLPGTFSAFEVLNNHAPIISSLKKGKISYKTDDAEHELTVDGGFVEVKNNIVTVCIERVLQQ
ncbi:MAG: FoF1 ATP synthase subunit delta/epsilon [Paludibacteraceae bacterium]